MLNKDFVWYAWIKIIYLIFHDDRLIGEIYCRLFTLTETWQRNRFILFLSCLILFSSWMLLRILLFNVLLWIMLQVNNILSAIKRKKSMDTIILSLVASVCTFLILIYWLTKWECGLFWWVPVYPSYFLD